LVRGGCRFITGISGLFGHGLAGLLRLGLALVGGGSRFIAGIGGLLGHGLAGLWRFGLIRL
jgi:hypothetical protein